ncbi:hypothetical protein RFM68_18025 [Mesorhizobium sp. MSK_1335]|uniref:WD40 repeat domain-containing protein n=1 Tax=Mesorhizobium montanum TaxID=3072323 RepID=A0ABU4ZM17_9HYPH|nr:hypothetical protein [Mesorhizobium sp. MSK_1335]MDX8526400.1 hypothetical protein [Mesorhizobium sp. MSK_1335]
MTGSGDCTIKLWDLDSFKEVRRFDGHSGSVYALALSADGKRLGFVSLDGTARIWNMDTGAEIAEFDPGHRADILGRLRRRRRAFDRRHRPHHPRLAGGGRGWHGVVRRRVGIGRHWRLAKACATTNLPTGVPQREIGSFRASPIDGAELLPSSSSMTALTAG